MRAKWVAMLVLIGVACFLVDPALASEKDEVNNFYRSTVETLRKKSHMKDLVALVEKNPKIAERCLAVCDQKARIPGKEGDALCMIRDELQAALFLRSKPPKCDPDYIQRVLEIAQPPREDDDQIFCLEKVVSFCPNAGTEWGRLEDLYLEQRRCGMAAEAYKKAADITGDQDFQKLLEIAKNCKEEYIKQRPLQTVQVKRLVDEERTMPPIPTLVHKANMGNSIQRQILFDEWSFQIKPQFVPELKIIGEGLREELSKKDNAKIRLQIEGHTDKRGPFDRNMQLSKDRANAIKTYLVQNYGINPAQLKAEGYGPTRPYSPEENEAGWALNRRVEFNKLSESSRPE